MGISYSNDARQFAVTLHSGQETQQAIHHVMIHDPFFSHVIHHHVIHPTGFSTIPFGSSYYF